MTRCETGTKQTLLHNRRVSTLLSQSGVGGDGGEPTPGARFSKVSVTFQIQNQVFKSNLKKTRAVPSEETSPFCLLTDSFISFLCKQKQLSGPAR